MVTHTSGQRGLKTDEIFFHPDHHKEWFILPRSCSVILRYVQYTPKVCKSDQCKDKGQLLAVTKHVHCGLKKVLIHSKSIKPSDRSKSKTDLADGNW